jgi:antitoxin CptB
MGGEIGKLRWHCRRGMRELDELLTRYVDEQYREAAPELKDAFQRLLKAPDPLICDYLFGREPIPDAVLAVLIGRISGGGSGRRS